ncbi:hypothetical protein [Flavobacterium sp.]|jgi:hypothetical protein|uniref:hypothetical protein n=1 Tax=Flavobacterium sp. TaxID=239 RepID=UPI0037BECEDF
MKTKLISRLGHKEFYYNSDSIETLLQHIHLDSALEFLVQINKNEHLLYQNENAEIRFILREWIPDTSEDFKSNFIRVFIEHSETKNLKDVKVINKISTLRTIEILLEKRIKIEKVSHDPESLFKLYLIINDEIANRIDFFTNKYLADNRSISNEIRLHLHLGLNQYLVNTDAIGKKLWMEALKFVQFEKWIKTQPKLENTLIRYLGKFNVNTLYELFTLIFRIGQVAINHHKFSIDEQEKGIVFFDYISNHNINSSEWNELSEIMKNPLYRMNNGEYLIIDFYFVLNKFFTGMYHDLLNFSNSENSNFHQVYSSDFIEKYLLGNAINSVFGNKYIQFNEDKMKSYKVKNINNLALPDYYIRNGNKVYLFECKNSLISLSSKLEKKYEKIETDFKRKFYESKNKNKAAKQLLNYINLSNEGKYLFFDHCTKVNNLVYYPIIITTDDTLTSLSFNSLINEFVTKDLNEMDNKLKSRIKPITIIHINDLLYRTTNLKRLDILIDSYHKHFNKKSSKNFDKFISFTDFIEIFVFNQNRSIDHKSLEKIIY